MAGAWATPQVLRRVAQRAEALGYASLWTFQRVLGPPDVLDPVAALAYVAGHTERIRLGTATLCAPFTAPAVLAKQLATVDVLSRGRVTVGLGMGWMESEYAAAGVPFARRGARMDEYLRCLKALWTQDPVEFAGEFYTVPRTHFRPPPVQRPYPPLLLGGTLPAALRRAGRMADGWIASSRHDAAELPRAIATVRGAAGGPVQIVVRRTTVEDALAVAITPGVTEVILDLNFAQATLADAERALETFATRAPSA